MMAEEDKPSTDSRVHFPIGQAAQQANITVQYEDTDRVAVHMGFLQIYHQYEISFDFKDQLSEDLTWDPLQNLHCKFLQVMPTEDGEGHSVLVDFSAHKEKILKEELTLWDPQNDKQRLTLVFNARVLGKGKGTPSLKNGIKLTGINIEEDSEQSDWQGFD